MPKKTIVPCSGGMDSVGLLWQLLKNTDEEIFVQHVIIDCYYKHCESEEEATANCIDFIKKYSRPFTVLPPMRYKGEGLAEYRALPTLCSTIQAIKYDADRIVLGVIGIDLESQSLISKRQNIETNAIFDILTRDREITRERPIIEMDKREWHYTLPQELIDMTTTCKHPTYHDGKWLQCNECYSCIRHNEAKLGLDPVSRSIYNPPNKKYVHKGEVGAIDNNTATLFVPALNHDNILYLWNLLTTTDEPVMIQPIEVIEHDAPLQEREKLKQIFNFLEQTTRKFLVLPPVQFTLNTTIDDIILMEQLRMFCVGAVSRVYRQKINDVIVSLPPNRLIRTAGLSICSATTSGTVRPKKAVVRTDIDLPDELKKILDC